MKDECCDRTLAGFRLAGAEHQIGGEIVKRLDLGSVARQGRKRGSPPATQGAHSHVLEGLAQRPPSCRYAGLLFAASGGPSTARER
jgi:hypothetical protein